MDGKNATEMFFILIEEYQALAVEYHIIAVGHDEENFRGCTHTDCKNARRIIKVMQLAREMMTK